MYFGSPVASRRLISSARDFCSSVHNPCLSMKPGGLLMPAQLPGDPGNQCVAPDHPVGARPSFGMGISRRPQSPVRTGNQPCAGRKTVPRNAGALQAPEQHQNDDDDQDGADDADAAVSISVAVAAETATEPNEQEDDQDDSQDESERHGAVLSRICEGVSDGQDRKNAATQFNADRGRRKSGLPDVPRLAPRTECVACPTERRSDRGVIMMGFARAQPILRTTSRGRNSAENENGP